jgi:hypothetical protein
MTRYDKGNYAAKHGPGKKIAPSLVAALGRYAPAGRITCAQAFTLAQETGNTPAEVGAALDLNEVAIEQCQLGLFGYGSPGKPFSPAPGPEKLASSIREMMVDGKVSCRDLWVVAARLQVSRMEAAACCDYGKIKICQCQLGAF